jgi:hypothetical protein
MPNIFVYMIALMKSITLQTLHSNEAIQLFLTIFYFSQIVRKKRILFYMFALYGLRSIIGRQRILLNFENLKQCVLHLEVTWWKEVLQLA